MSPPASIMTVGSWPRRADGAMNPPSVVTSSSRVVVAGDWAGVGDGEDDAGSDAGGVCGAPVGEIVGDVDGAGLASGLGVNVCGGWPLPQPTAAIETISRQPRRSFKAHPHRHVDCTASPRRTDDVKDH